MANLKKIQIAGDLPFDAGGNDDLVRMIGQLNLPAMGTTLRWGRMHTVPNEQGRRMTVFEFVLSGEEALSWKYLDRFKELVEEAGGSIKRDDTEDLEA